MIKKCFITTFKNILEERISDLEILINNSSNIIDTENYRNLLVINKVICGAIMSGKQ